jgi:hypothetical protein
VEDGERRVSGKSARAGGGRALVGQSGALASWRSPRGRRPAIAITSYTIVNWIHTRALKAQKTAGGQYRIRLGDLRDFMRANDMRTEPAGGGEGHPSLLLGVPLSAG